MQRLKYKPGFWGQNSTPVRFEFVLEMACTCMCYFLSCQWFSHYPVPMKKILHKGYFILLLSFSFFTACKKTTDPAVANSIAVNPHDSSLAVSSNPTVPYPEIPLAECTNAPYYGDSIVYTQPSTSDFYVYPVNNQGQQGTYLSWPGGLVINPQTGIIDLTQSETGARYTVGFVKSGTTDTCISELIIAGAAYMDSVYVLTQSDTTSVPYFNANPYLPSPCQDSSKGKGCQFDYNDFAKKQGVDVDKKTGYINLQKTIKNAFGKILINGAIVNTAIYYQLDDNSNNASQMIQLQLMYYDHVSDIPAAILATVSTRLSNTLNDVILSKGAKPRPPLIIIVRQN
jgi:hypothetical protein